MQGGPGRFDGSGRTVGLAQMDQRLGLVVAVIQCTVEVQAVLVAVDGLRVFAETVVAAQALGQCPSKNTKQSAVSKYVVGYTSPKSL